MNSEWQLREIKRISNIVLSVSLILHSTPFSIFSPSCSIVKTGMLAVLLSFSLSLSLPFVICHWLTFFHTINRACDFSVGLLLQPHDHRYNRESRQFVCHLYTDGPSRNSCVPQVNKLAQSSKINQIKRCFTLLNNI